MSNPATTASPTRRRILVVDDEPDLLEILSTELSDAGYEVTCAQDGREAVERARRDHFDVVLTDFKMPGMDGLATLAAIEALHPAQRAVLMTGFASDKVRGALKKSGRPFLPKPFELDDLLATLERESRR